MTLAVMIVMIFALVLATLVALMVALGLRRTAVADEGFAGQIAQVGRHLNGEAEVPERFAQLVARTES